MTSRRWLVRGFVAVGIVLAAGCGVETESSPSALPRDDVPFGLLDPPAPTTTSTTPTATTSAPDPRTTEIPVFFLGPEGLAAFSVEITGDPTTQRRLDALVAGPSDDLRAFGVRSAVPPVEERVIVRRQATTAFVELTDEFLDALTPNTASPALAQIVYTLTAAPQVARISFLNEGVAIDVLRPDGTPVRRPVTRADFPRALLGA